MELYRIMGEAQLLAAQGRIDLMRAATRAVRRWLARAAMTLTRQARIADLP